MMRVTVLGGGSWGTTVATLAARRNDTVLWARDEDTAAEITRDHRNSKYLPGFDLPPGLRATSDLEEACHDTDVLVVGIPSKAFAQVCSDASEVVRPWIPVVSLTKGFEAGTSRRMTELAQEAFPGNPVAALTGPNIAREVIAGQAAAAVIAAADEAVASRLQQLFQSTRFRVYRNHDVIGSELGGALKNVIAIATGIGQGLGVGDNTRAMVMTRGLAELTRLGIAMGGEAATFGGLAGMGDLLATCLSPHSRNRTVGEQLGRGEPLDDVLGGMTQTVEGVRTAATVHTLARELSVPVPICDAIHSVLQGESSVADAYRGLTPAGHEGHVD
jgi:glycerol-3-phosphate dehydrogenase (NAD(P)+)